MPRHPVLAKLPLLLLLLALPLEVANAEGSEEDSVPLKYTLGFDFSTGDYGLDDRTEIYFMPISIEADYYPFLVKVTLPFLLIDGPGAPDDLNPGSFEDTLNGGMGQLSSRVSYLVEPFHALVPWSEVSARLVAPTETNDLIGSGEWAFSLQADVFDQYGRVTPFASFGRTFYTGNRLSDRLFTSVGVSFKFTERLSGGLAYDWFEASSDSISDSHDLVGFASVKAGERWSVGPYGSIGLSNGSPDFGIGISFSFRPPGS